MNVFTVKNPIILGRETENGICTLKFPIAKWIAAYGSGGSFHLFNKRNGDPAAYPVVITSDNEYVYWTPNETDLAFRGIGEAQLDYVFGVRGESNYRKACSEVFETRVSRSIEVGEDLPEPYTPWVTLIESYADRAESAEEAAESAKNFAEAYSRSADLSATAASSSAADSERFKNDAAAILGLATFHIDEETGELIAVYPDPYAGAVFSINNLGYLEVTV